MEAVGGFRLTYRVDNKKRCLQGEDGMEAGSRFRGWRIALLAFSLGMPLFATAAEEPLLMQARRLLAAGDAQGAAELLDARVSDLSGNPHYDHLLGQALLAAGQTSKAAFAFERVLMVEPANNDARLRLAQIHAESGDAPRARGLLSDSESYPLDAAQQRDAERVQTLIDARQREQGLSWQGYLLGGVGWDSNVTVGPQGSRLLLPSVDPIIPTDLGDAAEQGDAVGLVEAGASLQAALGDRLWLLGGLSAREGFNRDRSDVREGFTNLYVGLARQTGSNLLSATALAQEYRVGGSVYRTLWSGRLSWTRALSPSSQLVGYYQYSDFHYPDLPGDDARRSVLGVTHLLAPNGGWELQYGAHAGEEQVKESALDYFGYRLWGLHLGMAKPVTDRLSVSAGVVYETHDHASADELYGAVREDRQWSIGLSADYRLAPRLHLIPQLSYVRNDSNFALYDYRRGTVMLMLRWDFGDAGL